MKNLDYYKVPLDPTDEEKELYRAADENIARVEIQTPDGNLVDTEDHRVILTLSKDGMLGLGSALIRAAVNSTQERGCWEFENASKEGSTECLGIYLHPSSCKLIVNLNPLGKVSQVIGGSN